MAKKFTIKEQIEKNKLTIKQRIQSEKENREQRKIEEAQKEAEEAEKKEQQKIVRAQNREERKQHLVQIRDKVFDNCCAIMKECNGLVISLTYERPNFLQRFNTEGKVKFSQKNISDDVGTNPKKDRIALLKVRNVVIAEIKVHYNSNWHQHQHIGLVFSEYNPRQRFKSASWADGKGKKDAIKWVGSELGKILPGDTKKENIPTAFKENKCSFLRNELVRFFTKITVEEGSIETTKTKKSSKKTEEEPELNEYQFIDLDEE